MQKSSGTAKKSFFPAWVHLEDIKKLRDTGLDKVILEEVAKGKPLLGICLGMQMLF